MIIKSQMSKAPRRSKLWRRAIKCQKLRAGFTLVEILVVVIIFATIGILATQSIILTLKGSRKSEAKNRVRENVEYATNVIERSLRGARKITVCTNTLLVYEDEESSGDAQFRCIGGVNGYIASGLADVRVTTEDVKIDCTGAVFVCNLTPPLGVPQSVEITIVAEDAAGGGVEGSQVTTSTKILLRNYK
jgi:prepilin-type N-terminal cleavage/methylation domain-containing protein